MGVISREVLDLCRSSPLTRQVISRAGGQAISSAVTSTGPMGVAPSRLLPKYHCLWPVCRSRAETSLRTV